MLLQRLWRATLFLVPLCALVLWSCDRGSTGPDGTLGPRPAVVGGTDGGEYTLIEGRIPNHIADLSVSKLIGVGGGQISLAGHTLTVPAGAVTRPTLFTMLLATNGYVEVDLKATAVDVLGNVVDVGSQGFAKPVTLTLTYAWASNVTDPSKLLVLYMKDGSHAGEHVPLSSTVSATGKTVTTELDHFSAYCMAAG